MGVTITWTDADYNEDQMYAVLLGRGSDEEYGEIDNLDPNRYDGLQMEVISVGRGVDGRYGLIDDLDPSEHDWLCMLSMAMERQQGDKA